MIKKVLIAGLFLGGGILFIKKILPLIKSSSKSKDLEVKSIDDAYSEADENMREAGRKASEAIKRQYGDQDLTDINTFLFAPNLNYKDLSPEWLASFKENMALNDVQYKWDEATKTLIKL